MGFQDKGVESRVEHPWDVIRLPWDSSSRRVVMSDKPREFSIFPEDWEDIRELVAQLFSIAAASSPTLQEFEKSLTDVSRSFKDKHLEYQTGCIIAIGFSLARYLFLMEAQNGNEYKEVRHSSFFKELTELVINQLNHSHALMLSSACLSIGEMGRCTSLPLDDVGIEDKLNTFSRGLKHI